MSGPRAPSTVAAELRRRFDEAFSRPPSEARDDLEELLEIGVAGDPYAIRLREIQGLAVCPRLAPVPAGAPALLGLVGVRGRVVPLFGLAPLLGYGRGAEADRWMLLCGGEAGLGLAFATFERHLRLPATALHRHDDPRAAGALLPEVAHTDLGVRPVISISLACASIRDRAGRAPATKEPGR